MADHPPPTPSTVWAYAYQVLPPQPERLLHGLMTLLDRENTEAQLCARIWQGRFVLERQVTHILVVSDNPELDVEANRRVEAALRRLKVNFAVTAPLAVRDETAVTDGLLDMPSEIG